MFVYIHIHSIIFMRTLLTLIFLSQNEATRPILSSFVYNLVQTKYQKLNAQMKFLNVFLYFSRLRTFLDGILVRELLCCCQGGGAGTQRLPPPRLRACCLSPSASRSALNEHRMRSSFDNNSPL